MAEIFGEPEEEGAILFFFLCGAFGIRKADALANVCMRGVLSGSTGTRLRRILRGLHPTRAATLSAPWRVLSPSTMRASADCAIGSALGEASGGALAPGAGLGSGTP